MTLQIHKIIKTESVIHWLSTYSLFNDTQDLENIEKNKLLINLPH